MSCMCQRIDEELWTQRDPLNRFRKEFLRIKAELVLDDLQPEDIEALGPYLFRGQEGLVWHMAQAMHARPDLFASDRPGWQELTRRQNRATSLEQTERLLADLLATVRRNRVREQGETNRSVIRLLARIDRSDRDFYESLQESDWQDPAVLEEHRRRSLRSLMLGGRTRRALEKWRAKFRRGQGQAQGPKAR